MYNCKSLILIKIKLLIELGFEERDSNIKRKQIL